jgi:hypothetical protein
MTNPYNEFKNNSPIPNLNMSFRDFFDAYERAKQRCVDSTKKCPAEYQSHFDNFHRSYFLDELSQEHLNNKSLTTNFRCGTP